MAAKWFRRLSHFRDISCEQFRYHPEPVKGDIPVRRDNMLLAVQDLQVLGQTRNDFAFGSDSR
jgi:hypothetical protein